MSRVYTVTFSGVAVTGAQDLVYVKNAAASNKLLKILRRWVSATDNTVPTGQMIQLRERRLPATVTDPSSQGSSPTPAPRDGGDAAATFTSMANATTKATTTGTVQVLYETGCHIFNGFDDIHDEPPTIAPGQSYVFELLTTTVTGTVHLSGGVEVEEIG